MNIEGKKAPAFTLKDKEGISHALSKMDAPYLVVYFYPKDSTPGCTVEAKEFSKDLAKFKKLGAEIVGISGGDEETKAKFCSKHGLKVLLLSDPDFKVCEKYGVYGMKSFMGRKFKGIFRKTFVLNEKRRVIKQFDKVKPAEHSKEVLSFLQGAEKGG